jgi:hypothetical protein
MGRGVSPASVVGVLAIAVSLSGVAVAATSGSLTLGTSNRATSSTTLHVRDRAALALTAPKGKPPLLVSGDKTRVPSLDASLLSGLSARRLLGQMRVYAKPATTSVHVPAGAHLALFTVVGGGGGGGGGGIGPGGAGGQGGYARAYTTVVPGQALRIIVGSPGPGGAADGDGGTVGGESAVAYGPGFVDNYLVAKGGGGGFQASSCDNDADGGSGGSALGLHSASLPASDADLYLDLVDGAAGGQGLWVVSQSTHDCESSVAGTGPGAGFAGAGGNGGAIADSDDRTGGADGGGGLVTVEYFS